MCFVHLGVESGGRGEMESLAHSTKTLENWKNEGNNWKILEIIGNIGKMKEILRIELLGASA